MLVLIMAAAVLVSVVHVSYKVTMLGFSFCLFYVVVFLHLLLHVCFVLSGLFFSSNLSDWLERTAPKKTFSVTWDIKP